MQYCVLDSEQEKSRFSQNIGEISPFDAGMPLFDCADETIREIYYYRWHVYCKHIRKTPEGHVITEFYPPVRWATKYNAISCPLGHQLYEGRWLHKSVYADDYARFWFMESDVNLRHYSTWVADAIYQMCSVRGDFSIAESLYEKLKENYAAWEKSHLRESGLFYQIDDRDGMEYSAGGSGLRPTINSYMYADALALSKIAKSLEKTEDEALFSAKAEQLKERINTMLWNKEACFFGTLAEDKEYAFADVRELVGFVPWYFDIPDADKSEAWKFLNDEKHFAAPYGPTTAERCHPDFMKWFDHECLWNGPSWPYATAQTLTALGNLLCNYDQSVMTKSDYFKLLRIYANSQYDTLPDGTRVPYIDENLDPFTGEWIARKILHEMENPPGGADRGADYNHSTFCDLVLSGLAGVRVREDEILNINPLFTAADMEYLCADGILYHGHTLCVLWDKNGARYGKGSGLRIYIDGALAAESETLDKIEIKLEEIK